MNKILIIANEYTTILNFRIELVCELINRKYEVIVAIPQNINNDLILKTGCTIVNWNVSRKGINPIEEFRSFINLKKIVLRIEPDIVLSYTVKPNIYGGIICSSYKIPYISNITGLGTSIENGGLLSKLICLLYKLSLKKCNKVFFQNKSNQKLFIDNKISTNNNELLPGSGVNLNKFNYVCYPPNDNIINFVFIGRITKNKGVDELLESFKIIHNNNSNVNLMLAGFCEDNYTEIMGKYKQHSFVKYLGHLMDVRNIISESHCIILPSYHEGTANVLLESASIGRPILASNIPGCNNTFINGKTGISFKPKDVNDLVRAIEEFINLPYEKKKEMGIEGRKFVEKNFDRQIVVDKYIEAIKNIEGK